MVLDGPPGDNRVRSQTQDQILEMLAGGEGGRRARAGDDKPGFLRAQQVLAELDICDGAVAAGVVFSGESATGQAAAMQDDFGFADERAGRDLMESRWLGSHRSGGGVGKSAGAARCERGRIACPHKPNCPSRPRPLQSN